MYQANTNGVYLERIDGADNDKIVIELCRMTPGSAACTTTPLTLYINKQDGSTTLDFDPWSDMNVVPDGSIDEKDVIALTDLAVAFYRQTTIDSEVIVFLTHISTSDDVLKIRIGLFERDEDTEELAANDYFYTAASVDRGMNFDLYRVNPHTGYTPHNACDLTPMLRAFSKMTV